MLPIHASFTHALAPGTHLRLVRLLCDMHRGQPGQDPTTSTEDASLHRLTYIPPLSANHLPIFMIPLIPTLLPSSPESCISHILISLSEASQVALVVKNLPVNAGDNRDMGLISGLGRSPGEGNGNPLQYSCLENTMNGEAWWATVHGVAKSQTQLSDFTFTFFLIA